MNFKFDINLVAIDIVATYLGIQKNTEAWVAFFSDNLSNVIYCKYCDKYVLRKQYGNHLREKQHQENFESQNNDVHKWFEEIAKM